MLDCDTLKPLPDMAGLETRYLLFQTETRLTRVEKGRLERMGFKHIDYVSTNTYLCETASDCIQPLRQLDFVTFADIYPDYLKYAPLVREDMEGSLEKITVKVTLHKGWDDDEETKQVLIARIHSLFGGCPEIFRNVFGVLAHSFDIVSLALIDEVRFIDWPTMITFFGYTPGKDAREALDEMGPLKEPEEVCYYTPSNDAREMLGLVGSVRMLDLDHQGDGEYIAIADSGLDAGKGQKLHSEFLPDTIIQWYPAHWDGRDLSDVGHGTSVCSVVVGRYNGSAPRAKLIMQQLLSEVDIARLFESAYRKGARIHSNSWGNIYDLQSFCQLGYNENAKVIDAFVHARPDMVICWAAADEHQNATDNESGQIGGEAAAKNAIVVGASNNNAPTNPKVMNFSSRGPILQDPYRIKPDLIAPGDKVFVAVRVGERQPDERPWEKRNRDDKYERRSGTSYATPLAAGCAAVVRDVLRVDSNMLYPTAALVKALLVNGARLLEDQPNFASGFGLIDMASTIPIARRDRNTGFAEFRMAASDRKRKSIDVTVPPQHRTLKATLAWTDPPGPCIRNRFLLEVTHKEERRSCLPGNNVQQIVWKDMEPGDARITVRLVGQSETQEPSFVLVWRFLPDPNLEVSPSEMVELD